MNTIDPTEAATLDGLPTLVGGLADDLGQRATDLADTVDALAHAHVAASITDGLASIIDALESVTTHTRTIQDQVARYVDAVDVMGGPDAVPTREFLTGRA